MTRRCWRCDEPLEVTTRDGVDRIEGPGDERCFCPVCQPEVGA